MTKSLVIGFSVLGFFALVGLGGALGYVSYRNDLVEMNVAVDTQWQQVENQLQRQHELQPKLVAVAERYVDHEKQVLEALFASREAYTKASTDSKPEAAAAIDGAVFEVLALAEAYPDLRADGQYRELSYEIAGTKNRIAVERGRYNELVGRLNTRLDQIPWVLVASGFEKRAFYEPPPENLEEPDLEL
jgi:LemA protein